jgi:hypothetical protein
MLDTADGERVIVWPQSNKELNRAPSRPNDTGRSGKLDRE